MSATQTFVPFVLSDVETMVSGLGRKNLRVESVSFDCGSQHVEVHVSRFRGMSGVREFHVMVRPLSAGSTESQIGSVARAYANVLDTMKLETDTAVFHRFLCSDLRNQHKTISAHPMFGVDGTARCATSYVQQSPAPPTRVALWAYHIDDPEASLLKEQEAGGVSLYRDELTHHWCTGRTSTLSASSYDQTRGILATYDTWLGKRNMTLGDNVIRTWFFAPNVDVDYQGLVAARREFFAKRGLTKDTHYIASTGIQGALVDIDAKVGMDAYAISGLRKNQMTYLQALDHLGPTHEYGVTFERAAAVGYRDRKQVYVSGTASIDPEGNIVYPGEVLRQLDRTLDNVDALLQQAEGSLRDLCSLIVYVRDPADMTLIQQRLRAQFGALPFVVVNAPVCRPGWLVEVEGIALLADDNPEFPSF